MARDLPALAVPFIHNRLYFFKGESRRDHHFAVGIKSEIVGRIQFNQIGAVRDLFAHGLARGPGRVDNLQRGGDRDLA